jgi:hypothetical protein
LTGSKSVHALFAPLDHEKMKHFFTRRGEESGERERRKREKRRDRTSLLAAYWYQIHNTQALRFAPSDLCDVISLLAAVTLPRVQAETSDFSWCMLQNLCI